MKIQHCKFKVATLVLLEGHEGYVDVAAWSPTDDVIVTGSSDRCHLLILRQMYPRISSIIIIMFRQAFLWHIHGHQAPDRVGRFFLIMKIDDNSCRMKIDVILMMIGAGGDNL